MNTNGKDQSSRNHVVMHIQMDKILLFFSHMS